MSHSTPADGGFGLQPAPAFQWIDRTQVRHLFNISVRTLQRYIAKGAIKTHSFDGGKEYFNLSELEARLRENVREGLRPKSKSREQNGKL